MSKGTLHNVSLFCNLEGRDEKKEEDPARIKTAAFLIIEIYVVTIVVNSKTFNSMAFVSIMVKIKGNN